MKHNKTALMNEIAFKKELSDKMLEELKKAVEEFKKSFVS
jgi:F0F1-type ATP synthase alpha subunit